MMFTGTNQQQDTRFSDKEKKLMKQMKFGDCLNKRVDMSKVKLDVLRPWISKKITDILHIEDDVVVEFVYNQLEEEKYPCPKKMQINMTGFLNGRNARQFMGELWSLLLSAQDSESGIPAEFIQRKKEEIVKREKISSLQSDSLRENEGEFYQESFKSVKSTNQQEAAQETSVNVLSSIEHIKSKLRGDLKAERSNINYESKEQNDEFICLKEKTDDETEFCKQISQYENIERDQNSTIKKKNSSLENDSVSSCKKINPHLQQYEGRRAQKIGSKSPNRENLEEKGFVYRPDEKKRQLNRSSRSSHSTSSFSSVDRERSHQSGKPRSQSRSHRSRSPRPRSYQRKRNRGSLSILLSPDLKTNDFKIRRNINSIQSKRHYRNNHNSSTSSVDRESDKHHRTEANRRHRSRSRSNAMPKSGKNNSNSTRSRQLSPKRRSSRMRSRSPLRQSRSPGRRRRSPLVRGRIRNHRFYNSNLWRASPSHTRYDKARNKLEHRYSPQRKYSRDRVPDRQLSPLQISERRVSPLRPSSQEKSKIHVKQKSSREQRSSQERHPVFPTQICISKNNESNSTIQARVKQDPCKSGSYFEGAEIHNKTNPRSRVYKSPNNQNNERLQREAISDLSNDKVNNIYTEIPLSGNNDTSTKCFLSKENESESRANLRTSGLSLSRTPSPFLKPFERFSCMNGKTLEKKDQFDEFNTTSVLNKRETHKEESSSDSSADDTSDNESVKRIRETEKKQKSESEIYDETHINKIREEVGINRHDLNSTLDFRNISNKKLKTIDNQQEEKKSNSEHLTKLVALGNKQEPSVELSITDLERLSSKTPRDKNSSVIKEQKKKRKKLKKDESCSEAESELNSNKKKNKKHKKRNKKNKKHKKRSKRFDFGSSEDREDCKKKFDSEPGMLVSSLNDDLEKKLRERALKSIKKSE